MHPRIKLCSSTQSNWIDTGTVKGNNCSAKLTRSTERGAASENCIVCSLPGSTAVPAECPHWPKGTAAVEQSRREETIPLVEQARSRFAVANQRPIVSCSQVSHHLFCPPSSLLTRCCVLLPPSIYDSFLASERKNGRLVRQNPRKSKRIWSNVFHNR